MSISTVVEMAPYKDGRQCVSEWMEFPRSESAFLYARNEAKKHAWVSITCTTGHLFVGQYGYYHSSGSLDLTAKYLPGANVEGKE